MSFCFQVKSDFSRSYLKNILPKRHFIELSEKTMQSAINRIHNHFCYDFIIIIVRLQLFSWLFTFIFFLYTKTPKTIVSMVIITGMQLSVSLTCLCSHDQFPDIICKKFLSLSLSHNLHYFFERDFFLGEQNEKQEKN